MALYCLVLDLVDGYRFLLNGLVMRTLVLEESYPQKVIDNL